MSDAFYCAISRNLVRDKHERERGELYDKLTCDDWLLEAIYLEMTIEGCPIVRLAV